ncbi:MAG: hypothetical protein ACFFD1_04870 [Candidatus Thorarchaeota archaeon]
MLNLPFGNIDGNKLVINMSTADYTIAAILNALNDCLDVFEELSVEFLGCGTDVKNSGSPSFSPTDINIYLQSNDKNEDNSRKTLLQSYKIFWKSLVRTYPDEETWSNSRSNLGNFISAQAELLLAMKSPADTD